MKATGKDRNTGVICIIFFLILLSAELLPGTELALVLARGIRDAMPAANSWRSMGNLPLISWSVTNVRDVKIK